MQRFRYIVRSLIVLLSFTMGLFGQTVYYVNATTGNNSTGTGSVGSPYKTITKAISVSANAADSIKVAAGVYSTSIGEVFPLDMPTGRKLIGTAGAATTFISAANSGSRVFNCNNNANITVIQGFTITGGVALDSSSAGTTSKGGAFYIDNSSMTIIQQNIITGNLARGYDFYQAGIGALNGGSCYGGAIYIAGGSAPTIQNNVFASNIALGGGGKDFRGGWSGNGAAGGNADGGAIHAAFGGASVIINNTFYANQAQGGLGGSSNSLNAGFGGNATSGAIDAGSNAIVKNNIFANNMSVAGSTGGGANGSAGTSTDGAVTSFTAGNLSNNLYFANVATTNANGGTLGTSNVMADPMFVGASNYHLQGSSPALGAGTATGAPAKDFDGKTRPNPPAIGAYNSASVTGVNGQDLSMPQEFSLSQNYPNPFNPETNIEFRIANFGLVTLKIFDVLGREVAELVNEQLPAGQHSVTFRAGNLSSGLYLYRIAAGDFVEMRKMLLMK